MSDRDEMKDPLKPVPDHQEEKVAAIKRSSPVEWVLRVVKGVLIGIGFITPGLSGGVIAVILGLYEPLIRFLGNPFKNFLKNVLFFLPVGIGGALGVVLFSKAVDWAFAANAAAFTWLFIGFIVGTYPSLFKTAGLKGRNTSHWVLMAVLAAVTLAFMRWLASVQSVQLAQSFINWVLMGALIGLGVVVPGMSPSNFLIYLGMYQPMAAGIGGLLCVLLFAKGVNWLFDRHYAGMYHAILGIVIGSTIAIIPGGVSGWNIALCVGLFLVGVVSAFALSKVDEAHPRESLV